MYTEASTGRLPAVYQTHIHAVQRMNFRFAFMVTTGKAFSCYHILSPSSTNYILRPDNNGSSYSDNQNELLFCFYSIFQSTSFSVNTQNMVVFGAVNICCVNQYICWFNKCYFCKLGGGGWFWLSHEAMMSLVLTHKMLIHQLFLEQ